VILKGIIELFFLVLVVFAKRNCLGNAAYMSQISRTL